MAELIFLGAKVGAGMMARARAAGNALGNADAASCELLHFVRIVREQAHGTDAQRFERRGGEIVIARVRRET